MKKYVSLLLVLILSKFGYPNTFIDARYFQKSLQINNKKACIGFNPQIASFTNYSFLINKLQTNPKLQIYSSNLSQYMFRAIENYQFSYKKSIKKVETRNYIRLGFGFGMEYIHPNDINDFLDGYLNSMADSLIASKFFKEVNIGFTGNFYLACTPSDYFDLRAEFDYVYVPKHFKWNYGEKIMNLDISTYSPGISANLLIKNWRFGVGYFYNYTTMNIRDFYYESNLSLRGKSQGFQFYLGSVKTGDKHGTTITLVYKGYLTKQLVNEQGQVLMNTSENRNFILDHTAIELRFNFFFSFLNKRRITL